MKLIIILFCVLALVNFTAAPLSAQEQIIVGRLTYMEGDILRYVPETKDWTLVAVDAPLAVRDVLYSDTGGRVEIRFPDDTIVRLADETQVEVDGIAGDLTAVYMNSGVARFYNNSTKAVLRVVTPFGYAVALAGTQLDLYVGDSSMIVTALKDTVSFVHTGTEGETKYNVEAGNFSLLVDATNAEADQEYVDTGWDKWNVDRDAVLAEQASVESPHLPAQLQSDAYALEENGTWEQVSYQGETEWYWRPTNVDADWSPYRVGRWTTLYDEQVWIPHEPFGYVTHHYGGWVFLNGRWYWMPPKVVGAPHVLPWCPGRVAWIHNDAYVGWVPLARNEVYYGHRYWGPNTLASQDARIQDVRVSRFFNVNKTVIVKKADIYSLRGNRYEAIKDRAVIRQTIATAKPSLIVDKTVINNVRLEQKFIFTNAEASRKPNVVVTNKIEERQRITKGKVESASVVKQKIDRVKLEGPPSVSAGPRKVPEPLISNRIVKVSEAKKDEVQFPKRSIISTGVIPATQRASARALPQQSGKQQPSTTRVQQRSKEVQLLQEPTSTTSQSQLPQKPDMARPPQPQRHEPQISARTAQPPVSRPSPPIPAPSAPSVSRPEPRSTPITSTPSQQPRVDHAGSTAASALQSSQRRQEEQERQRQEQEKKRRDQEASQRQEQERLRQEQIKRDQDQRQRQEQENQRQEQVKREQEQRQRIEQEQRQRQDQERQRQEQERRAQLQQQQLQQKRDTPQPPPTQPQRHEPQTSTPTAQTQVSRPSPPIPAPSAPSVSRPESHIEHSNPSPAPQPRVNGPAKTPPTVSRPLAVQQPPPRP